MSDAPERIWAWFFMKSKQNDLIQGGWTKKPDKKETEYIRADIHAAAIARAERAEAALAVAEEALQRAASYFGGCSTDRPFAAWNNVRNALAKIAALKGTAK